VRDYLKIIEKYSDAGVMVVNKSRFSGKIESRMLWRYWFGNMLPRFLAGLLYRTDIPEEATAYKTFRREVITQLPLQGKRFEFCPEISAQVRKRGHFIHKVPVRYNQRTVAEGKNIRTRNSLIAAWTLVRLRFLRN
jgi:dolichol-phosphate mannosyltransferase